ncbi:sensor histidine kinase [Salinibacter altiplanensis]|uniref:sensor histidine kinase n=1 Tax=Salinibacter altiplanensis TaxID=1803181 RepID=UPI000C9F3E13|nr:histidine kinase [Salinibacter altiplanensis]
MARRYAYWLCQIGGWTAYAGMRITLSSFFQTVTWGRAASYVVLIGAGVLYTHLYRRLAKRHGWTQMSLGQLAPRVVAATLVASVVLHFTMDTMGRYVLELDFYEEIDSEMGVLLASVVNGWILLMLWSLIYFGVHYFWSYRKAEVDKWKLEAQAETARLKALKLQLNPHFFFNSLNSVRALIAEDPDRAQRMVTRLARLLRGTLQADDMKTVSLEEELSTVRTYLELEKVRFEDRLRHQIEVDDEARSHPVPFMLVQTLVENGIKHGVACCRGGGVITVRAEVVDEALRICVTNPGTLDTEEGGTGLDNARERLELLFGAEASLTVENTGAETVSATAMLPIRVVPDPPAAQEDVTLVARG